MEVSVHIIVEGLVQGVGYRWFAARRAQALGLGGSVRNLYDGTVEVEAWGDRSMVEELIGDLKVGPRSAQVRNLKINWGPPVAAKGGQFEIR
ncbi:MAG TPA: acylphosphatase [Bacteroidota bacterium]|nr:acylphosphatase [Bacteroidota bacterium]